MKLPTKTTEEPLKHRKGCKGGGAYESDRGDGSIEVSKEFVECSNSSNRAFHRCAQTAAAHGLHVAWPNQKHVAVSESFYSKASLLKSLRPKVGGLQVVTVTTYELWKHIAGLFLLIFHTKKAFGDRLGSCREVSTKDLIESRKQVHLAMTNLLA